MYLKDKGVIVMNYEAVLNIINAHYGWSMDAHEPEYKDEIKEKMQAMKQLVSELPAKAKAFDDIENLVKTELTSDDLYSDARNKDYSAGMLRVYERVDYIIDEYESGESDELRK